MTTKAGSGRASLGSLTGSPNGAPGGATVTAIVLTVNALADPDGAFSVNLRRPLRLRCRKELQYWLVDDYRKTRVRGVGDTPDAALSDYMATWGETLADLTANEQMLGEALLQDLNAMRMLLVG